MDLKQFYLFLLKTILQNVAVFYRALTVLDQESHQTQPACSSGIQQELKYIYNELIFLLIL